MKVTGSVGLHSVHILIDSSSTHNFLDVITAKKLRCSPLVVAVADGGTTTLLGYVQGIQLYSVGGGLHNRCIHCASRMLWYGPMSAVASYLGVHIVEF